MGNYVGNMWSSLNELDSYGAMNIVANEGAVGESIIAFLLTKKGEDPFAPDYGLEVNIFQNLNELDGDIWGFYVQEKLKQYVTGLRSIVVKVFVEPVDGKASVYIDYAIDLSNRLNSLTFPYQTYTGIQRGDVTIEEFIDSIALNNNRFKGLTATN